MKPQAQKKSLTMAVFTEQTAQQLISNGQFRTARAYRSALNKFNGFLETEIPFHKITPAILEDYQRYLKALAPNTQAFYMRNLRAIYNRAATAGIFVAPEKSVFSNVFTGTAQTEKRALSTNDMNRVLQLTVNKNIPGSLPGHRTTSPSTSSGTPPLKGGEFGTAACGGGVVVSQGVCDEQSEHRQMFDPLTKAQVLFAFSFFTQGIAFVDAAYLTKDNLKGNVIIFRRKKTGVQVKIEVNDHILYLLNYFAAINPGSKYLLPILNEADDKPLHVQYENALRMQNYHLKKLGQLAGLNRKLTTYVARHTWATIAKSKNTATCLISQGLGHKSERTTAIYLGEAEQSAMAKVNAKVCRTVQFAC